MSKYIVQTCALVTSLDSEEKVILNVGGMRHETTMRVLRKLPETKLSRLCPGMTNYDSVLKEYFFDRHPEVFMQILNYYRTGKLHYPTDVCGPLFEEELRFWGLESNSVEPCCWMTYTKHKETKAILSIINDMDPSHNLAKTEAEIAELFGYEDAYYNRNMNWWQQYKPKLWFLFERHDSSIGARLIQIISLVLIVLSILSQFVKTMGPHTVPVLQPIKGFCHVQSNCTTLTVDRISTRNKQWVEVIDMLCNLWFTLELTLRFLCCPSKLQFAMAPYNIIDFLATLSYYVDLLIDHMTLPLTGDGVQMLSVFRIFRLFKLSQHNTGLQILWETFKASLPELVILTFSLLLMAIMFSALIYYSERFNGDDNEENDFKSIPIAMWWAISTMTTVGPGDFVPHTTAGQIVGALCAITSILTVALPVPVIVNNFENFYSHKQAHSKLPRRRRINVEAYPGELSSLLS